MELQDFQMGSKVVQALALYGQWTMGAAAGLAAFFTDEEARSLMADLRLEDAFDKIAQTAEAGGNTPAGVLGVDGSLVGIMADLQFGSMVDPLTWFFAANRALGINGLANRVAVSARMGSPAMKVYLNSPNEFVAPARSAVGQATFATPFIEVGNGGRLLEVMGQQTPVIPPGTWRQADTGYRAQVVPLHYIESWSDDIAMGKVGPKALYDAKTHLQAEGFDHPIEAVYSPAEGRLVFYDPNDMALLRAAADIDGLDNVPLTVRVLDEKTGMNVYMDRPPPWLAPHIWTNETKLLNKAFDEWMDSPATMHAAIDEVVEGTPVRIPRDPELMTGPALESAQQVFNLRNGARALIRWFNKNKVTVEPGGRLYRGVDGGSFSEAGGEVITLNLASATDDIADAAQFGDVIYSFDVGTEFAPHPTGQKLSFVSGQFESIGAVMPEPGVVRGDCPASSNWSGPTRPG
jgi:hypothetical protein